VNSSPEHKSGLNSKPYHRWNRTVTNKKPTNFYLKPYDLMYWFVTHHQAHKNSQNSRG